MSLIARLTKASTVKETSVLEESTIMDLAFQVETLVPAINIALGGELDTGLSPGFLQIAGPSKHFKTNMALVIASAFLKKFKDAVILFYDSEFGASKKYFQAAGIDTNRVVHTPIKDIEELKFDIMNQLKEIKKGDRVLILIDSIGNLASKKEVEDAIDGKSVADMTRAKQLKSLFRMVTPHLTLKELPMIAINHTYKTMELYAKDVVGGGTGGMYSANDVWIITRSQEKNSDGEIDGWTFKINIEKSRRVKEKSQIPVTVMFDGGIQRESGLQELATDLGYIISPTKGWYSKVDPTTGEIDEKKYRAKDMDYKWFSDILLKPEFRDAVKSKYQLPTMNLVSDDDEYEVLALEDESTTERIKSD